MKRVEKWFFLIEYAVRIDTKSERHMKKQQTKRARKRERRM